MNDMLNSLEGFDSGSNYQFGDKMIRNKNPRSVFDLSHLSTMTIPNAGMIIPVTCWETLPSDDFDISVDGLLRVLPQVVPLYSRQRLYIYGFWSRYSDLWNNWQVFMDKGYSGNDNRKIPQLIRDDNNITNGNIAYFDSNRSIEPNSLFDYLGLPIGISGNSIFGTNGTNGAGISALKAMMFLRIYRDYFLNKNEWINDRVILPDDDSRFRLDDDGKLLSAKDNNKNFYFIISNQLSNYDLNINGNNYLFGGCFHDYPDDYFTSALPFPQRGSASQLNYNVDLSQIGMDFSSTVFDTSQTYPSQLTSNKVVINNVPNLAAFDSNNTYDSTTTNSLLNALNKGKLTGTNIGLTITLEDIRKLAVEQSELEQLARTDGSYRQFGLSFFGESSKASYDYRPLYIGGTYKNLAFTEVLQTATTQTTDSQQQTVDNALGAYGGHGITGITDGRIGHIHCDDYGMIMILACIMPDTYYSQGLDRLDTDSLQSDKFMPERVKLGYTPILNKELFYAGNNGNAQGEDNYLWAYQNPFDYLRYMPNKIHGKIADSTNKSFYPYTQSRKFTTLPNWGRTFSEAKNIRKDYLVAPSEDAYTAQFKMNIRAVRPLPYRAIPAKLI